MLIKDQIESATTSIKRQRLLGACHELRTLADELAGKGAFGNNRWPLTEDHYYAMICAYTQGQYSDDRRREPLEVCLAIMDIMKAQRVPISIEIHEEVLRLAVVMQVQGFLDRQTELLFDASATRDNTWEGERREAYEYLDEEKKMKRWEYRGGNVPEQVWSEDLVNLWLINACMRGSSFTMRARTFMDVAFRNGYKFWPETLEAVIRAFAASSAITGRLLLQMQQWGYPVRRELLMLVIEHCIFEENNYLLASLIPWALDQGFDLDRGTLSVVLQLAASASDTKLALLVWSTLGELGYRRTMYEYEAMLTVFVRRSDVLHAHTVMSRMAESGYEPRRCVWKELSEKEGRTVPRLDHCFFSLRDMHANNWHVPLAAVNSVCEASALAFQPDRVFGTLDAITETFGMDLNVHSYNAILLNGVAECNGTHEPPFLPEPEDAAQPWGVATSVLDAMAQGGIQPNAESLQLCQQALMQAGAAGLSVVPYGAAEDAEPVPAPVAVRMLIEHFDEQLGVAPAGNTLRNAAVFAAKQPQYGRDVDFELIAYARRVLRENGIGEAVFFRKRLAQLLGAQGVDIAELGLTD